MPRVTPRVINQRVINQDNQDIIQDILNKFTEYMSWYQQGVGDDDVEDCSPEYYALQELDFERRDEMFKGRMGAIVMNYGNQSQKEWLIEFADEYNTMYWNENEQKFE